MSKMILIDEATVKLAAEFNRHFTSMNGVDVPERVSVPREEWRELFAALAEQELALASVESASVTYKEVADAMNALYMGDSKQVQIAKEMENKKLYTSPQPAQQEPAWRTPGGIPRFKPQPAPMIRGDIRDGLVDDEPAQQEPVAWMHEWEDGERIPMLTGRDDRNNDQPKSVRPLVYGDTPQAQPAQQEPVGYEHHEYRPYGAPGEVRIHAVLASQYKLQDGTIAGDYKWLIDTYKSSKNTIKLVPLYTSPPAQRTWVGLTHDEYDAICDKHSAMSDFDFLDDIEAKLKEKNT